MAIKIQLVINVYTQHCHIISQIQNIIIDNDVEVFYVNRFDFKSILWNLEGLEGLYNVFVAEKTSMRSSDSRYVARSRNISMAISNGVIWWTKVRRNYWNPGELGLIFF